MATMSTAELMARLASRKPIPAILLLGSDAYLRNLCIRALLDTFAEPGAREWAVARLSCRGDGLPEILRRARTLSLLSPVQVLIADDVEGIEKFGEEARREAVELLQEYLNHPSPSTVLVFEATSLDQRMSLFKALSAKALVVRTELDADSPESEAQAAELAQGMAQDLGAELAPDVARLLAEMVNAQPAALASEIEKLATHAGETKRITREAVDALVVSEKKYSVWKLTEILAEQKPGQALVFLDSLLREGEEPPAIVGALAWMYRKLIQAQELPSGTAGWQAARQLQMRPDTAEMAIRESQRLPRQRLLDGLAALAEADNRLKLGRVEERAVLEFLAVQLGGRV